MEDIILGIGPRLKQIRQSKRLTLSDLASEANISAAMVSKVENGRTMPSLPVLLTLLEALEEDYGNFFRGIVLRSNKPYFVIRKQEYQPIQKEDSEGYSYQMVFNKWLLSSGFEIVLLTVDPGANRAKTVTDAFEFKFMLSGQAHYVIGEDLVELNAGDALYFDGRIPHNPENHGAEAAVMLVIYFYLDQADKS